MACEFVLSDNIRCHTLAAAPTVGVNVGVNFPTTDTMAKLTQKHLEAIRAEQHGETIRDEGNLFGRIRAKNCGGISVSFSYRYRWDSKTKEISCGTWPKDGLAAIRKHRDEAKKKIQDGIEPGLDRKAVTLQLKIQQSEGIVKLEEKLSRNTVGALFDYWCEVEISKRRDGGAETKRGFRKDILPVIGHLKAEDVTRADIMRIVDIVLARGSNRMAKRFLSELRQMFGFGLDREIVHTDPTARIKKDRIGGKDVVRTRHLSEVEIKEFSEKLPSANFAHATECALWIMLSTCCRVGEISRARWQDLNLAEGTWTIPKEHAKNERELIIYLSDFAEVQFRRLETLKSNDIWMFPDKTKTTHVNVKSISKQVGDRQRTVPMMNRTKAVATLTLSGGHWTPHDLRRTGATIMGDLGTRPDVIEKCLNHTEESKIKRTYQQQSLKEEQRDAWHLLGERLALIVNPSDNVVPLLRTAY